MPIASLLFSLAAVAVTVIIFVSYIRSILRGTTKPHVFTWVIWAVVTLTVFFAQVAGGAGLSAWPIGISGLITSYVAVLACAKRVDSRVTVSDWAFLLAALCSLPLGSSRPTRCGRSSR